MRIVIISQDFPPDVGGTQTYAARLADGLVARGHQVHVVCPDVPEASSSDATRTATIHRVPSTYDSFPFRARSAVQQLIRDGQAEAALAVAWPSVIPTLRGDGRPAIPVALAVHGREMLLRPLAFPTLNGLYDRIRRSLVRRADLFLPVSRFASGLVEDLGVRSDRVRVVHNGADPDVFFPDPGGARNGVPTLLSVCRLVPRKGVDTVIAALPQILNTVAEVRYVVVGDGPERPRLEEAARELGVNGHVHFAGRMTRDALRRQYAAAHVFVLPARHDEPDVEGFGIVFLEANACGLPVVGARTGGIPDAIVEGETGLLVEPDDPEELARSVTTLLEDPLLAKTMGQKGRERVERELNWSATACQIDGHLTELLRGAA